MTLSRMSLGYKLAITLLLINILLGLLFAHMQLRGAVQYRDGEEGLSVVDMRYFFSGDPSKRVLQTEIRNPTHWSFTTPQEKRAITEWILDGAPADTYESSLTLVMENKCVSCHQPDGERASSPLTTYEEVRRYTELADTGVSYEALGQLSLFGILAMSFAAALVAGLFYYTRYQGFWKDLFAFLPFIAIFCNVLSWWSAKQSTTFVHIIIGSALVFGILICLMVVLLLVDIWILPEQTDRRRMR